MMNSAPSNQDVVRGQLGAIDNHAPEALTSPMFAIKQRQIRNREAETLQRLIRDRALREIEPDLSVAEFFR
jgi:hypothetical protein